VRREVVTRIAEIPNAAFALMALSVGQQGAFALIATEFREHSRQKRSARRAPTSSLEAGHVSTFAFSIFLIVTHTLPEATLHRAILHRATILQLEATLHRATILQLEATLHRVDMLRVGCAVLRHQELAKFSAAHQVVAQWIA